MAMRRHALHALSLRCTHPSTGLPLELHAPLAEDMRRAMDDEGIALPTVAAGWTGREGDAPAVLLGVQQPDGSSGGGS